MSHRAAGVSFCAIAALLYATRYLAAALFTREAFKFDPSGNYARALQAIPSSVTAMAWMALLVGLAYLSLAEVCAFREMRSRKRSGDS